MNDPKYISPKALTFRTNVLLYWLANPNSYSTELEAYKGYVKAVFENERKAKEEREGRDAV